MERLTKQDDYGTAWVIVELAPDAILLVDEHGHIAMANQAAVSMFGYDRETLFGLDVEALLPSDRRETHRGHRASYHTHPRTRPMGPGLDLRGRRADDSEFPVEISLSPIIVGDSIRVVVIAREMPAQRPAPNEGFEGHGGVDPLDKVLQRLHAAVGDLDLALRDMRHEAAFRKSLEEEAQPEGS